MKANAILFAGLFAAAAILPPAVGAAMDRPTETPAAVPAPTQQVKPHSHVEEKTGVPQKAPVQDAARQNAAKDKTKHFHPRDMK